MAFWSAPQELHDLAFRYARALDGRDAAMLAAIFTTDGRIAGRDSGTVRYTGAEGWARMIGEVTASFADTMHNVFNQTFDRSEDGTVTGLTTGIASHLLFPRDGDDAGSETSGLREVVDFAMRYHDQYAIEDGHWKFRERRLEVVWVEHRKVSEFSAELMSRVLKGF